MTDDKLDVKKQEQSQTPNVCMLDIDDIFVQLHQKAIEKVATPNCIIQNSALEGKDKNIEFYGPGKHIVAALPNGKGKKSTISKTDALAAIQQYLQWFAGPDVSSKITDKDLQMIEGEEGSKSKSTTESIVPTFAQYILLEAGEETKDKSDDESDAKDSEEGSADAGATSDEEKPEEAKPEEEKKDEKKNENSDEAAGWYVSYVIEVAGQKASTFSDIFGKFTKKLSNAFKMIGFRTFSLKGGESGFTIGDIAKTLDEIFGKIDPNELAQNFGKEMQKKFPQSKSMTEVFDKGTILKHLKGKLDGKERGQVSKADLSLCVKVHKDDKSKKLINTKVIAELLTHSIKGIVKTFKNSVDKKDVILVNGYAENDKTKNKPQTQLSPNKNDDNDDFNAESISSNSNNILLEANELKKVEDVLNEMQEYLQKEVDTAFSDAIQQKAEIKNSAEIIKDIKDVAKADEKAFNAIRKHKNAYKIEIETEIESKENNNAGAEETKESMTILHASKDLLRMLFEEAEATENTDPNKSKVEEIFRNLVNKAEFLDARGKKAPENDEIFAFNVEAAKNESISNTESLYNMLFDDVSAQKTLRSLIYEASNYGKGVGKEIIQKKGFKNLVANIDKMEAFIKANYKTEKGKKKEESTRYKALELFGKFKDCKSDEDMEKFIDDNFKDGGKDSPDNRLRTAFIKAMDVDGIPDKEEESSDKIKITFKDIDDPSQLSDPSNISDDDKEKYKQIDEPIEVKPGEDVKTPDVKDKDGFKFDHFDPDPKSMKEDGDTFAIYKKDETDDSNDSCKIKLFDADPKSGEKTGDPIAEFDVPKGQPFNSTDDGKKAFEDADKQLEDSKKDGFTFKGWNKDASEKAEEDTELVAKYLADDDKDKEFTVIFQYPPDPSKEDAVEEVPGELGTQKIKAGESAEQPEPPEIEGWKFKKWSDDTSNVTDDMMVLAEYQKPARFIFKAPKDPEKPEDDLQPIGDPIEAEDGKAPEPPTPPEFDDYEFDKWNPDPKTIKDPSSDQEIIATYKKKDDGGDGEAGEKKKIHTIYVLPDYAGILDESKGEHAELKRGGEYDFYIVPMKGLKYKEDNEGK